jgi:ABC-type multidrug transport system permease subunit
MMNHSFLQLFICRLREFYREPHALFWVYGFPLILAVGLGFAFRDREPDRAAVDVVGTSDDDRATSLRNHLGDAGLSAEVHNEEEAKHRLRIGKTALYVVPVPEGFRYVYDRVRPEGVGARDRVNGAILLWKIDDERNKGGNSGSGLAGNDAKWQTTDDYVTEPGNRYIDFLMPGLLGMNIMGGGLFGVGFVIVDMRIRKLLKRLVATPMRRGQFLGAMLAARLVMLFPEVTVLLTFATLVFGVPIRGNLLTLVLVILTGAFAFAGIGLLLAARAAKTETISGLINLIMMPGWLLSGTFFSARRFPDAMQPFIQALPLTQLNDALREVMLEGKSLTEVAWRIGILALYGSVTFVLALKWFRWV